MAVVNCADGPISIILQDAPVRVSSIWLSVDTRGLVAVIVLVVGNITIAAAVADD
jgi:hypothetical protein